MSLLPPALEAFLAIAQLKTVHGAARQLHMTQTAITQRIRSLESRLRGRFARSLRPGRPIGARPLARGHSGRSYQGGITSPANTLCH